MRGQRQTSDSFSEAIGWLCFIVETGSACVTGARLQHWWSHENKMIRHVVVCCCWILHHYKGGAWRVCLWLLLSGQSFSEIKSLDYFGFFRWLNCSLINFCVLLSSSQRLHACVWIKHCNWLQFILPQDCLYLLKSLLVCSWATRGRGSAACGLSLPEVVHLANVLSARSREFTRNIEEEKTLWKFHFVHFLFVHDTIFILSACSGIIAIIIIATCKYTWHSMKTDQM